MVVLEPRAPKSSIQSRRKITNVATPAMIWFSVSEEMNDPSASSPAPSRKIPR